MNTLIVKTASEDDFFKRGRTLAKLADENRPLPEESMISFEDPADMLSLLTAGRMMLFRAVKEKPGSITAIAEGLHRDRSAVKRDIDALEKFGLLMVDSKVFPGHGRMKEVRVSARQFKLEALMG